jgi:hypothetical protein
MSKDVEKVPKVLCWKPKEKFASGANTDLPLGLAYCYKSLMWAYHHVTSSNDRESCVKRTGILKILMCESLLKDIYAEFL